MEHGGYANQKGSGSRILEAVGLARGVIERWMMRWSWCLRWTRNRCRSGVAVARGWWIVVCRGLDDDGAGGGGGEAGLVGNDVLDRVRQND